MSIHATSPYQSIFQYKPLSETRKNNADLPLFSDKMNFILSLIKKGQEQEEKLKNDNFHEDSWWECGKCHSMNLKSVWRCAYCGNPR